MILYGTTYYVSSTSGVVPSRHPSARSARACVDCEAHLRCAQCMTEGNDAETHNNLRYMHMRFRLSHFMTPPVMGACFLPTDTLT